MGLIWEVSLTEFLLVTVVLGGAGAWLTGRAVALQWRPALGALLWTIPLAAAVRFIHFALFSGSLLTLHFYLVDLVILAALAFLGHRRTRALQMQRRYPWLFSGSGAFSWRRKGFVQSSLDAGHS